MSKNSVTLPEREYKNLGEIRLQCPVCKSGVLKIKENDEHSDDCDMDNKKPMNGNCYYGKYYQFGFRGVLECENPNCHKRIVFAGNSWVDVEYPSNEDDSFIETNMYRIEYIACPPHLIGFNDGIPPHIKYVLHKSFQLYWIDLNSCANKIRVCLERIMDEFSEHIQTSPLGLGKRIESLVNKIPELRRVFDDAKWVGDSTYHTEDITEDDLCNGYEMLKCVLNKLFRHGHKNQSAFKTKSIFSA